MRENFKTSYHVIGLMSGTSLDGLDIAYCYFTKETGDWQFEIREAETLPYDEDWRERLKSVENGTAIELMRCDKDLGHYFGRSLNEFINKNKLNIDLVASHGHTIFHRPEEGFTTQIGNAAIIRSYLNQTLVYDFRSLDVALGGQGAPLVPIGDELLFSSYEYCLNLGGIANISYAEDGIRKAFDICPCNMALNLLAKKLGFEYDPNGQLASEGNIDRTLLAQLSKLAYYQEKGPKSLGKEWFLDYFQPLLEQSTLDTKNLLCTVCEHIAQQIARCILPFPKGSMMVSGGGALNQYLLSRLRANTTIEIEIPDTKVLHFKEALIFAFLGLLRVRNEQNTLRAVTGARISCSSGSIL